MLQPWRVISNSTVGYELKKIQPVDLFPQTPYRGCRTAGEKGIQSPPFQGYKGLIFGFEFLSEV